MTDKQIIIDGVDVSRCMHYDDRYGYCEACRDDIDGASFTKCLYEDNCYYKQLKRAEAQCEAMFVTHTDLEKKYKAKEQECEELKKIINEAKNSKLDLKSFLVGEAVQNEYEQQLDQLKEQLEAYKMEAEEGKEINAELKAELTRANCQIADDEILQCDMREAIEGLKAENDELKHQHQADKGLITSTGKMNYELLQEYDKLKTALTEIKEIAENAYCLTNGTNKDMAQFAKQILQKISEVEDESNN